MRRLLIPFIAAFLILAAGYAGLWFYAEQQLAQGFQQWADASRANGWKVSSAAPERSAAPLAAILIVPDLSVVGGDEQIPGGLSWHASRVLMELSLLHPRVIIIRAEGRERLRLSALPELPFTAEQLRALVPLQLDEPPRGLAIEGSKLAAALSADGRSELTVGRLELRLRWAAADSREQAPISVALRAADIVLPRSAKWPLGPRVALLSGDAALSGRMPPVVSPARQAAAWRDSGGQLQAQRVTLTWGTLNLSGNGTLSLDRSLQPIATATARVVDPAEALNSLVAHGAITRRTAFAAHAVLALMERAPEGGGAPVVELPVAIQDRTVSVGSIPLARLPTIAWPE